MADQGGERKSDDLYAVLGLKKECTSTDLRNAYKKLALRWHPDRCCAAAMGNSKFKEEANKKFQAIQEAYSVLSDETKRFLYDVGVYDNDDDDNNHGMGEFLNEMAAMMCDNKPTENGEESFEQLQDLFEEMFQTDVNHEAFASTSMGSATSCSSSYVGYTDNTFVNSSNKRNSSEVNKSAGSSAFSANFQTFCVGAVSEQCRGDPIKGKGPSGETQGGTYRTSSSGNSRRRQGRKQKVSSGHDVSCNDYAGIFPLDMKCNPGRV